MRNSTKYLVILMLLMVPGCAGPGSTQITRALTPDLPASDAASQKDCPVQRDVFFAESLCDKYNNETAVQADADANPLAKVDFVATALRDSRKKCQKFVSQLTGLQAGENTTLDVLSLTLSGLASVLTPVNTVRGLAAASTAVQGTKQAINSDLFQQMSIALFVQQINTTYYQALSTAFPDSSFPPSGVALTNFSAAVSLAKIEEIHRNCSIPFSAAAISANQGKTAAAAAAASVPSTTVKISGTITRNDVITLTAKSATSGLSEDINYTVQAGDTALKVADGLIAAIHNDLKLAQADVSGMLGQPADNLPGGSSAQFTAQGGPADIAWTYKAAGAAAGATATEAIAITAGSTSPAK